MWTEPQYQELIHKTLDRYGVAYTDCSFNIKGRFGAGHPDLIVHLPNRDIYIEIKSENGYLKGDQPEWFEKHKHLGPVVVWPKDYRTFIVPLCEVCGEWTPTLFDQLMREKRMLTIEDLEAIVADDALGAKPGALD